MNEKLIKQLQEGTIAVKNDGTLEDLKKVLKYACPKDNWPISGTYSFYIVYNIEWKGVSQTKLPSYSVKEFLKEETMEKKIIGYKLIKPEYKDAAEKIAGINNWEVLKKKKLNTVSWGYDARNSLQKAGVLDLWFEKVYEEEIKVGDYVTVIEAKCGFNGEYGKTYKLLGRQPEYKDNFYFEENTKNTININTVKVRKATPEEIEEVSIKLPVINGYEGRVEANRKILVYGCAKFPLQTLKDVYHHLIAFNYQVDNNNCNRKIASIELSSGINLNLSQLALINKYLDAKGL